MAAYIDLNPARAGLVEDPKDYRWCGYAEAVAGNQKAQRGLEVIWADYARSGIRDAGSGIRDTGSGRRGSDRLMQAARLKSALSAHRSLIFGKGASPWTHMGKLIDRKAAEKVLNEQRGELPLPVVLRCRVRYFTDGVVLGSAEFVRRYAAQWQAGRGCQPAEGTAARGAAWGDLAVVNKVRRAVFGAT